MDLIEDVVNWLISQLSFLWLTDQSSIFRNPQPPEMLFLISGFKNLVRFIILLIYYFAIVFRLNLFTIFSV